MKATLGCQNIWSSVIFRIVFFQLSKFMAFPIAISFVSYFTVDAIANALPAWANSGHDSSTFQHWKHGHKVIWLGRSSAWAVLLLFEGAHPAMICESVPRSLPLSVKTNDNNFDNCNCLHTRTITHTHTQTPTHTHTHTYTHKHVRTHTQTHTHRLNHKNPSYLKYTRQWRTVPLNSITSKVLASPYKIPLAPLSSLDQR